MAPLASSKPPRLIIPTKLTIVFAKVTLPAKRGVARIFARDFGGGEKLRIVLAVAGFSRNDLDISLEDNQLMIRGKLNEQAQATFLHRGIAAPRTPKAGSEN
jgi:HSP20 family molecular chaperone IbpA